jgi:tRNA(Arg) A34 adenosine deaminase TadA
MALIFAERKFVSDVIRSARAWLIEAIPEDAEQETLTQRLLAYANADFRSEGDAAGWAACGQAFVAISRDQYGIGALILDAAGHVVAAGHNEICGPPFRSEAHAEMVVLSDFERRFPDSKKDGLTLHTSLEPCPMCYTRILI